MVSVPLSRLRVVLLLAFVGGFATMRRPLDDLVSLEHLCYGIFPACGKAPNPSSACVRTLNNSRSF